MGWLTTDTLDQVTIQPYRAIRVGVYSPLSAKKALNCNFSVLDQVKLLASYDYFDSCDRS